MHSQPDLISFHAAFKSFKTHRRAEPKLNILREAERTLKFEEAPPWWEDLG